MLNIEHITQNNRCILKIAFKITTSQHHSRYTQSPTISFVRSENSSKRIVEHIRIAFDEQMRGCLHIVFIMLLGFSGFPQFDHLKNLYQNINNNIDKITTTTKKKNSLNKHRKIDQRIESRIQIISEMTRAACLSSTETIRKFILIFSEFTESKSTNYMCSL